MQLTLGQKQVMDHNHIAINKNETMNGLSKYEKNYSQRLHLLK